MVYQRALEASNLEPTKEIPLMGTVGSAQKFCLGVNSRLALRLTGMRVGKGERYIRALYKALGVDMIYTLGPSGLGKKAKKTIYGDYDFFRKRMGDLGDAFHLAYRGMKLAQSPVVTQFWVVERPFRTYEELVDYLGGWDRREQENRSIKEIAEHYRE